MSIYIKKMQQLCFLQHEKKSFYYHKITNYIKASEKGKDALDDNAEVIFQDYYNGLQNINKNVKTLTTITIVYCIIILIGVLGFLFQLFKLL